MIRYPLIFMLGLAIVFGQKQAQEKKARGKGAEAKTASKTEAAANVIPAGAVEVTPNVYKHTDSSGKTWMYRKTPFGIVKFAETADDKASDAVPSRAGSPFGVTKSANSTAANVNAVEEGDIVRFERTTPFGPSRWTRKKSELTAEEQEIVEQSRTRNSENTETKK